MLTLVFVLGFLGIGLVQNISSADDTNPTRNTTVDCNFYIFIHDEEGNPVENVVVNAYSNPERTDLVGTSQPSNSKGWAHITTCTTEPTGELRAMVYFAPDTDTLPDGQKNYQAGDADVLKNMVNTNALEKGFLGADDDEYNIEDYIQGATEVDAKAPATTKAVTNLGTVFPGQDLEADGIVGYDAARYDSWFYATYMFASFKISPGEPEQPDPEPEPEQDLGNLSIAKTTSDNNTSTNFNVKITLSGTSTDGTSANTISGTYGDATFDDGIATISIKHNQTKNITGLPAGINYSIEELNPGDYAAAYTNQNGAITKDRTTEATINNKRVGSIVIRKYWWGGIYDIYNIGPDHGHVAGRKCGKYIINTATGRPEWREITQYFPGDLDTIEAVFEIEFENLENGEFLLENTKEPTLRVEDYKGKFTLVGHRNTYGNTSFEDIYFDTNEDIRILNLPIDAKYRIIETSVSYDFDDDVDWDLVKTPFKTVAESRGTQYFYNYSTCKPEQINDEEWRSKYKITLKKDSVNKNDDNQEYEFTILPLFGYANNYRQKSVVQIPFDGHYGINATHDVRSLYSVWLHGKDAEKVPDREWFVEYGHSFWDPSGGSFNNLGVEQYDDWTLSTAYTFRYGMYGLGMETGGLIDPSSDRWYFTTPIYADPESVEEMVRIVDKNTNNFFKYEGNRAIEKSRLLQKEISSLGYGTTVEWIIGTSNRVMAAANAEERAVIMDEFINCFTSIDWTVDDFRYFRVASISESNIPEGGGLGYWGEDKTIYDIYNDVNDEIYKGEWYESGWQHFADTGFDPETNKYFFGRTFKLKNGESIELNFPLQIAYDYGFLILEKKTGDDMEYTQDNSIIASMQYIQKDSEGNYRANVVYNNTYPAPEPEPEEEPEPEVPPKEIPVETVNPRTGDMKILPMIIMAGSALVLALGLLGLRRTKRI